MTLAVPDTLIQRKTLQACEACRARRVKCDGHQQEYGTCSNCKRYGQPCHYGTPTNALKWGTKAYIEDLQLRIASMERLIKRYAPDKDLSDLDDIPSGPNPSLSSSSSSIPPSGHFLPSGERVEAAPSHDVQDPEVPLITDPVQSGGWEYHGSTSLYRLVEFAFELRDGAGHEPMSFEDRFPNRRRKFWEVQDWMSPQPGPSPGRLEFPPPDVITSLVDSYFTHSNVYHPVLHRPTFQRLLNQELYQHNHEFGGLLLVVCAIGARFSDHPYVSDANTEGTGYCIAHWLSQTREAMKKPFPSMVTLFEVQYYCLYAICLHAFPAPMRWATLGMGIVLAKSVGAHHMKTYGGKPTIEGELWRRVFWVLLNEERLISLSLGRPCSVKAEEFDLDLPIDCDDEYWPMDDESEGFKQPSGKPSKLTLFILMSRLSGIHADAARVIYPHNRASSFYDLEAEKQVFETLDVETDKWAKSIPEYLRQTSFGSSTDPLLVRQSIYLHAHYHKSNMWVRRSHTLPSRKDSLLAPAATAMCTSSAVNCFHLLYKSKHQLDVDLVHYESAIFAAACTFLINSLSQRPLEDTTQDRVLLEKCLELFEIMEKKCHTESILFSVIRGMVHEPGFDPLGPHAKRGEGGMGWVVNTGKPTQSPTSTSESSRFSGAGVTGDW